ncbi:MAG: hypothetical protein ACTHOE_14090 [Conexibacter sp.]
MPRTRAAAAAAIAGVASLLAAAAACAGPISLDASYGAGGIAQAPFAGENADAGGAVLDGSGRLVVVGAVGSPRRIALVRYLSSGALDPSFGVGGRVSTLVGVGAAASGIVVQDDGDVVVAGVSFTTPTSSAATVVRYLPNGELDTSFGAGGIAVLPSVGREVTGVTSYEGGKLVVAGAGQATTPGFSVARLTASGKLDPTFDGDGVARVPNDAGRCGRSDESGANDVLERPDGSLLVAGLCGGRGGHPQTFGLVAFDGGSTADDQALDTSFGVHGASVVSPTPGVPAFPVAIERQPDGMLLQVGQSGIANGSGAWAVVLRRDASGALDPSFGVDGVRSFHFSGTDSAATGVALAPDGSIFVSGTARPEGGFGLARLTADGALNAGFGVGGTLRTAVGEPAPKPNEPASGTVGALRQADGRILVVGTSRLNGRDAFTVLRYSAETSAGGNREMRRALGSLRISPLTYDGRAIRGRLRCHSGASGWCRGRIALTYALPVAARTHAHARRRVVRLGSARFALRSKAVARLRIAPTRAARSVLAARRRIVVLATFSNARSHERLRRRTALTRVRPRARRRRASG